MYSVGGDDGEVVVTVLVREGEVSGDVVVEFTTTDNSATCKKAEFI